MVSQKPDPASAGAPAGGPSGRSRPGDPILLKQILDRSATMRLIRQHMRQGAHRDAWRELVGDAVARQARASVYRRGKLFVDVSSAALLQELCTYRKAALLEELRQKPGYEGIVDIVFRHGGLPDSSPGRD